MLNPSSCQSKNPGKTKSQNKLMKNQNKINVILKDQNKKNETPK